MRSYDAILVPGNGIREGGALPTWVQRQLNRVIELYAGEWIITLSAGTTHRPPPLDPNGFPIFESVASAAYLIAHGVPAEKILTETCSYDTIGNAFFSRVIHVEPRQFRRLMVIAADFHLARIEAVFRWVYGLEPAPWQYDFSFEGISDPDMAPAVRQAREAREQNSLDNVISLSRRIATMADFHRWLFNRHSAYSAGREAFLESQVGGATLESY